MRRHPEQGMVSYQFFDAIYEQGAANAIYDVEVQRLRRAAKDDAARREATEAVWQARLAQSKADDQIVRLRFWNHVTKRVDL